jgi:anaphase-promoting complex subunit 11
MKVTIKSASLIATWSWSHPLAHDEVCGICRVAFDGTCPTCKFPGDECPLLIGKCQHSFHMHCLLMWVQQESSRGLCPMCRQPFQWKRSENMAAARRGMIVRGVIEDGAAGEGEVEGGGGQQGEGEGGRQ